MGTDQLKVLVVDDEKGLCDTLIESLTSWGYQAKFALSAEKALDLIRRQLYDVALVDIRMEGMTGQELLREIKRHDATIDVVMITGYPEVATAVETLKAGACDYLVKPFDFNGLHRLLERLRERRLLRQEVRSLRDRFGEQLGVKELIGVSPPICHLRDVIARVAATDSPILIEGETGTGKDVLAATIHRLSARSQRPYVPVNCGALPAELLESELFGHVRGAFTGAVADTLGLFRAAHGGTIFLDEVVELPRPVQVKLLRVLQDKEVRPVGSSKRFSVDVRIIAATNHPLQEAIRSQRLREDLFYRLDVIRLTLPPLRERKADIPALAAYFLRRLNQRFARKVQGLSPEAMSALAAYDFPGNVRELENILERAYALGASNEITLSDLSPLPASPAELPAFSGLPTLAETERALILRALQLAGNNKDQAARALGISRRTFYRRLKEYGLL